MTEDAAMRTAWHLAVLSKDLRAKPVRRIVAGLPIALFRTAAGVAALADRCPHRNYPLTQGRIDGDGIVCPYHGWRFSADGTCTSVPGCAIGEAGARLAARTVKVREAHGAVFVLLEGDAPFPEIAHPFGDPGFDHFWWDQGEWSTTVFDAVENVMDPFHTSELHHGHIRDRSRRLPVTISVENFARGIEMTIDQSEPDHGFMARMFERNRTRSRSRFDAPSRFQGVWEGPDGVHISVMVFFTPVEHGTIRPIACFTTPKGVVPGAIKAWVIRRFIAPVIRQDRAALAAQAETVRRFGSPRYAAGPGDPLGGRIRQLMDGGTLTPGVTDRFEATL